MAAMRIEQKTGGARGDERPWGDVLWLAGQDIRRTWPSYPASALYLLVLGVVFGAPGEMGTGTYSFEFIMFAVWLLLATPFFAREYMSWSTDPIAERLAWLRVLPIGVPTIVRSRALALVVALPLNVVAFFTPAWFGSRWGLDAGAFLWFCLAMAGISLAGAGATLALEMSVGIRRWIITNLVGMAIVLAVILAVGLLGDFRLFERLARAVAWNGPLVALACVAGGIAILLGCVHRAEAGLRRRELAP